MENQIVKTEDGKTYEVKAHRFRVYGWEESASTCISEATASAAPIREHEFPDRDVDIYAPTENSEVWPMLRALAYAKGSLSGFGKLLGDIDRYLDAGGDLSDVRKVLESGIEQTRAKLENLLRDIPEMQEA